jgi:hypothetical protein
MNSDKKQPITVEALMRLKRVEQPPAEFWAQFDKELRVKQLAAIVDRRPWWHAAPRVYGLFSRHPLALGTAAALTVALFTVGEYRGNTRSGLSSSVDGTAYVPNAVIAPVQPEAAAVVRTAQPASKLVAVAGDRVASTKPSEEVYGQELQPMISSPTPEGTLVSVSPRDEMMQIERGDRAEVPLGKSLTAIKFAAIQPTEPEFMRSALGFTQTFQAQISPNRGQVTEPLANMPSPSDERRSRLMAEATPVMASFDGAPAASSDHFVNRLPDDRVYESISRYADSGDRLSIKF